ncbi:MAG: 50S ribosomal protein L25 [Nitrospirae bacterium]|nr:50S ribosomal protein L25 [Nitrospirota bacterium]MBF0534595.1 50S ribosomal protein L25 [Nitrospirota bacterium]MBF0616361.1 50S ribosomal protein L25 [Nitrospirota bacterium]
MERVNLAVQKRDSIGKGAARTNRRDGMIPAVMYKKGQSMPIRFSRKELVPFVNASAHEQILVNLNFSDGTTAVALMKDHQVEPVTGELLHVDFQEISLQETVRVNVAIILKGTPIGVKRDGGLLQTGLREIEIESLPDDIPAHIELDVTKLELGGSLHVSDIKTEEKIKILTDQGESICTVSATAMLESAQAEEGAVTAKEPEVVKKGKQEIKEK